MIEKFEVSVKSLSFVGLFASAGSLLLSHAVFADALYQTHLCSGETKIFSQTYHKEVDFKFKARSTIEESSTPGKIALTYDFATYMDFSTTAIFNGYEFLLEWAPVVTEKARWTGRMIVSPLFNQDDEALTAAAEYRFMYLDGRHLFTTTVFSTAPYLLDDGAGATVRVYNRKLEVLAEFHCATYRFDEPADVYP